MASGMNSMWLDQTNPHAVMDLLQTDPAPRSVLALRRQKNRESMQRSRQRKREQLQLLRKVVTDLEQQYHALRLRAVASSMSKDACNKTTRYSKAVELLKRLGAENLYLKASIQSQASWEFEIRRVIETTVMLEAYTASKTQPFSPFLVEVEILKDQEAESVFGHHMLNERDVKNFALQNTQSIKQVQDELLVNNWSSENVNVEGAAGEQVRDDRVQFVDHSEVFGWDSRRRIRGSEMAFVFTKRVTTNLSVLEIMQKTWADGMHLEGSRRVKYDVQRLDMLQEVNANAYVLGRDVRSPDEKTVFRTTLLRYRTKMTEKVLRLPDSASLLSSGETVEFKPRLRATRYVIGTQSLNPAANSGAKLLPERAGIEPSAPLVWAELALTIELLKVYDCVTGEDKYVQVRWSGTTNYGSTFDAHRNAADVVTSIMRWELGTIAPAIQLSLLNMEETGERDVTQETDGGAE
uniref:BZIP domain-containing protein n=1 Tax=Hyaloperonospora arabidopsidis (strain Emoy2) TaxID=559515 RepID=M4BMT2_HYAAE